MPMGSKQRLDKLLVERGLASTREKAQALILAGRVQVAGISKPKAGWLVLPTVQLQMRSPPHPFVSRGGQKLQAAIQHFQLNPKDMCALDIGASTGGFTHCLLLHGAAKVVALDVGRGQLAWELRQHPRVKVMEGINIRHLPADALPPMDWVVIDVSFISLKIVLQSAACFLKSTGVVVALVKPQFEAGRQQIQKGGRVHSPTVHEQVVQQTLHYGNTLGWQTLGSILSPIQGKKAGNKEFLVAWQNTD